MTATSLTKRFTRFARRRHDGSAWLFCAYVSIFVLALYVICMTVYRVNVIVEYVENTVTASVLAGVSCDAKEQASTGNLIISDVQTANDDIRRYILKNLSVASFSEDSPYFDRLGDCTIDQIIIYNCQKESVTVSEFEASGALVSQSVVCEAISPNGEQVTKTGCYVEFTFPIDVLGQIIKFTKGSHVNVWL